MIWQKTPASFSRALCKTNEIQTLIIRHHCAECAETASTAGALVKHIAIRHGRRALYRSERRSTGTISFFPERGKSTQPAKNVCAKCPVLAKYRAYALDDSTWHLSGVWGGLSERERRRIRLGRVA